MDVLEGDYLNGSQTGTGKIFNDKENLDERFNYTWKILKENAGYSNIFFLIRRMLLIYV